MKKNLLVAEMSAKFWARLRKPVYSGHFYKKYVFFLKLFLDTYLFVDRGLCPPPSPFADMSATYTSRFFLLTLSPREQGFRYLSETIMQLSKREKKVQKKPQHCEVKRKTNYKYKFRENIMMLQISKHHRIIDYSS